jgi:hypothetical protein
MQRDHWQFEYVGAKLAEASETKRRHHSGRLQWWLRKKREVMAEIRSRGISVHESVAEGASQFTSVARGAGARIMVNATLQADLDECSAKAAMHRERAEAYSGWVQVLRANPEAKLRLDHSDWLYFFGETATDDVRKDDRDELDDDV